MNIKSENKTKHKLTNYIRQQMFATELKLYDLNTRVSNAETGNLNMLN